MTLQEFINKYNGKYVGDGQCGALVRQYWIEVDKTNPPSYTSSKDYWFKPVPGYDKVQNPKPGDIAIYNGHGSFVDGHSAIYVDGRVFEQNADPDGSPAHVYLRLNTYLLGYLHKQGGTMDYPNKGDLVNIHNNQAWPGHDIGDNDVAFWCNGTNNPAWGNVNNVWVALVNEVTNYAKAHPEGFEPVTEQLYKKKG